MSNDWLRVGHGLECPICTDERRARRGGRVEQSWCMVASDRTAVICPRVPSDRYLGSAGWLHVLVERPTRLAKLLPPPIHRKPTRMKYPPRDWPQLHSDYMQNLEHYRPGSLGISVATCDRLGIGIMDDLTRTIPMRNEKLDIIGIRTRHPDGSKRAIGGSKQGLFIPLKLAGKGPLLICEGPTDTGAALDLGFDALGRPSCRGCEEMTRLYVSKRDVVIIADNDGPGQEGAHRLAIKLFYTAKTVRIVRPFKGKDMRDWTASGLTASVLGMIIRSASVCNN